MARPRNKPPFARKDHDPSLQLLQEEVDSGTVVTAYSDARRTARSRSKVDLADKQYVVGVMDCGNGTGGRLDHFKHQIGMRSPLTRAAHALALDRIGALAQSGRIQQQDWNSSELQRDLENITGRPRQRCHYCHIALCQEVYQTRFSHIWRTDDRDDETFTQPLPLRRLSKYPRDLPAYSDKRGPRGRKQVIGNVALLASEVDLRLDKGKCRENRL